MFRLESRSFELVFDRLPASVWTRYCRCAIGSDAADSFRVPLPRIRVGEADNDIPEVLERYLGGENGFLLTTVLRVGSGEDRCNLADTGPFHPDLAGLVEEVAELTRHVPVTGRNTKDNCVRPAKVVR